MPSRGEMERSAEATVGWLRSWFVALVAAFQEIGLAEMRSRGLAWESWATAGERPESGDGPAGAGSARWAR